MKLLWIILLAFLLCLPVSALSGYNYSQQVNLSQTGWSANQTGYDVKLNVYNGTGTTSGNNTYLQDHALQWGSASTWADIRVTDSSSNVLPIWFESTSSNTTYVPMWVNVSTVYNAQNTTLTLWYGNSTVATNSSGYSTFLQYDNFYSPTTVSVLANDGGIIPAIAQLPNGNLFVPFEVSDSSKINATNSTTNGGSWGAQYTILTKGSKNIITYPRVLVDGNTVNLFYTNKDTTSNSALNLTYSTDNTTTWSTPTTIDTYGLSLRPSDIKKIASGRYLLAADYTNATFGGCVVYYSDNQGSTWNKSANITYPSKFLAEPTIAQLSNGTVIMFIRDETTGDFIFKSSSADNGTTWAAVSSTTINSPSAMSNLITLSDGTVVLLWHNTAHSGGDPAFPRKPLTLGITDGDSILYKVDLFSFIEADYYWNGGIYQNNNGKIDVIIDRQVGGTGSTFNLIYINASKSDIIDGNNILWSGTVGTALASSNVTITGAGAYRYIVSSTPYGVNTSFRSRTLIRTQASDSGNYYVGFGNTTGGYLGFRDYNSQYQTLSGSTVTAIGGTNDGVMHIWEAMRNGTVSTIFAKDNAVVDTQTTGLFTSNIGLRLHSYLNTQTTISDWVIVRPYFYPEPTVAGWEAEQNYTASIPVANFTANTTTGTSPLNVSFTDSSTNTPTSWYWEFGDGNTSTTQSPTHLYYTGNWSVNLSATNAAGTGWKNGTWINVTAGVTIPDANFTVNASSGAQPLSVQFNDTSTNTPTSWFYDFGDGNNTTTQNPVHVYSTGNWFVNMSATNTAGTDWKNGTYINVTSGVVAPVGNFTSNVTSGKIPLSVQFWDNSTNTPTMWNWSFGDGSANGTTQNPVHVYSVAGVYSVNLTAGNAAGNGTTFQQASYINASALAPPVADFHANTTTGYPAASFQFTDDSTNAPTSWAWQWGDGSDNTTTQNAVHSYANVGNYTVNLTATNADGSDTEQKVNYIIISATPTPPVANFTANVTTGTIPLYVGFTDNSTNSPTSWAWQFGDGSSNATTQNPTHVYSDVGTFTVNLTATNADGSDTEQKLYYITPYATPILPTPAFTANVTSGLVPISVQFNESSTNTTTWYWDLGDGNTSLDQNPVHTYYAENYYTVKLQASNANGSVWLNKTNYLWFTNPATPIPTATQVHSGGYAPPYQAPDVPFPQNNNTGCHLLNVSVDTTNNTVTFTGQVDNVTNDTTAWFTLGATGAANSYYTVALVPDPVSGNVTGSMGLSSPMAAGTKYYVRMASTKGLALESLNFTTPAAVALPTSTYGAYWNKVQASNKTPLTIMNAIPLPLVDLFGGSAAGAGNEFGWRIVFTLIIGLLVMVIAIRQDNLILVFMLIGLTGPVWLSLIVPEFVWIPATVAYLVAATTLYRLYRNRRS